MLTLSVACALASGCGSSPATGPVLQPLDLQPAAGVTFQPNEIIPVAGFIDSLTFTPAQIQAFLAMNPYGTTSFLSTYQSSGIFASDAISAAAATYGINPIVLMIRAEVDGGLIGAVTYPLPAQQVEYVFGCGCMSPSSCDPSFAGFDKQVDCLASTLRISLDQIAVTGQTAGGWAAKRGGETLDGVDVTPADASTAALYQYDPIVGQGKSDNWLVWNLWQLYTSFLSYVPPPDIVSDATAEVGDPCLQTSDCANPNAFCAPPPSYPGGMCTSSCTAAGCEGPDAFCADYGKVGYCLARCSPTDPASCRTGYACTLIDEFMNVSSMTSSYVCAPAT